MSDDHAHRIERLEDRDRETSKLVGSLDTQIQSMNTRLIKMDTVLAEVRDRVLKLTGCPDPYLCFEIKKRLDVSETKLREMEIDRTVLVKGWKAVGIICAVATAVVTAGYGLWNFIEHVIHRKP
jgi:hypothetical protein